jgi:hypothetical protein
VAGFNRHKLAPTAPFAGVLTILRDGCMKAVASSPVASLAAIPCPVSS